jgi:UDP-N-acetylmuramyl pentapeptide phosphotransferase/UDP-N-acetylglucosamine-1-phosphate transferase
MNQYSLTLVYSVLAVALILTRFDIKHTLMLAVTGLTACLLTKFSIPKIVHFMIKADIYGYDINKKGSDKGEKKSPECIGFAAAISFIVIGLIYTLIFKK